MSSHQKLEKKYSRKFTAAVKRLLPKRNCVVDFTIFLPPDNDQVVQVLAEVDRNEMPWEFQFTVEGWECDSESNEPDLFPFFKRFFRKHWKTAASSNKFDVKGYLRIHDDNSSINLRNGKQVDDIDRDDIRSAVVLRPYRKKTSRRPRKRPESAIKIGWSIKRLQTFLDSDVLTDQINDETACIHSNDFGIRAQFTNNKLDLINVFPPFNHSIGGIWLGLHVSDVEKILGLPTMEDYCSIIVMPRTLTDKLWYYPDNNLKIFFDKKDCALMIQRYSKTLR